MREKRLRVKEGPFFHSTHLNPSLLALGIQFSSVQLPLYVYDLKERKSFFGSSFFPVCFHCSFLFVSFLFLCLSHSHSLTIFLCLYVLCACCLSLSLSLSLLCWICFASLLTSLSGLLSRPSLNSAWFPSLVFPSPLFLSLHRWTSHVSFSYIFLHPLLYPLPP